MAVEETLAAEAAPAPRLLMISARTVAMAGGALLAAAGGAALLFGGAADAPAPAAAPAAQQSELGRLMQDVALQIEAQVPFAARPGATFTGASASGERLVFELRLAETVPADGVAARASQLAAADAAELCGNSDMRWLIEQGGTIERRYTDAGGRALRSQTASCAGHPAAAAGKVTIPVAM